MPMILKYASVSFALCIFSKPHLQIKQHLLNLIFHITVNSYILQINKINQDKRFDIPTCKRGRGYWAWWPHLGDHVRRSSPGLPAPVCRGAQPPRTCPGRHTGSPGCGGSSGGPGSHNLLAERQLLQHCRDSAGLERHEAKKRSVTAPKIDIYLTNWECFIHVISFFSLLWSQSTQNFSLIKHFSTK